MLFLGKYQDILGTRDIMSPTYSQIVQEKKTVWNRFIEREIVNGTRYKYESQ